MAFILNNRSGSSLICNVHSPSLAGLLALLWIFQSVVNIAPCDQHPAKRLGQTETSTQVDLMHHGHSQAGAEASTHDRDCCSESTCPLIACAASAIAVSTHAIAQPAVKYPPIDERSFAYLSPVSDSLIRPPILT